MADDSTDWTGRFDAKEWAMGHEKLCAERYVGLGAKLDIIMHAGGWAAGIVVAVLLGTLGWSLKTNWDTRQESLAAIPQAAAAASTETMRQLNAKPTTMTQGGTP